jgi:hypothetical protein
VWDVGRGSRGREEGDEEKEGAHQMWFGMPGSCRSPALAQRKNRSGPVSRGGEGVDTGGGEDPSTPRNPEEEGGEGDATGGAGGAR